MPKIAPSELRRAERHLRAADPRMARLVAATGRCRLDEARRPGGFSALVEAIVYQQLSIGAASTIWRRFSRALGGGRPTPAAVLAASDEDLRAAGVSRQKIGYLRDLASAVEGGRVRLRRLGRLDDEAVVEELTRVKGIGRWTAEMYLIFRLGRLDVLPVGDLGVRDAVRQVYELDDLPGAAELLDIGEPWRPYRSVACWYLWRTRRGGLEEE